MVACSKDFINKVLRHMFYILSSVLPIVDRQVERLLMLLESPSNNHDDLNSSVHVTEPQPLSVLTTGHRSRYAIY